MADAGIGRREAMADRSDSGMPRGDERPTASRTPAIPAIDMSSRPGRVAAADALADRSFLIVSAPFGPFARRLAAALRGRGAAVTRMIFNAGDLFDWRDSDRIRFDQPAGDWAGQLPTLAQGFTDILVFGEGGPYNQGVLSQTDQLDARVWVLENGYFRPDWITLERDGVNARSGLPRDRSGYDDVAPEIPTPTPVGKILPHHVLNISLYHLLQLPGRLLFPRYARPYTQPPWLQAVGHVRRYLGLAFASQAALETGTIAARGPFFVACLQREGDVQLLRYSRFADNTAFLAELMTSFVRAAPADCRLVVKNHPLDPGLINQADMVRCLAVERGIADRVDFIDGGNLAQLCRASRGMVVNNSSAALSALGFHTPVKVMGQAFFDFEGLTDQQPLDRFWNAPQGPDPDLFARFRAHVIARTQVNGNFHDPRSIGRTVEALADAFDARVRTASDGESPGQPTLRLV
jgi:capsular polysaccharide export protein